jgi:hypothetical protein
MRPEYAATSAIPCFFQASVYSVPLFTFAFAYFISQDDLYQSFTRHGGHPKVVKLADSIGQSGEGFTRIFGNEQIGLLFSKVQAAVIRSGFELETVIWNIIPDEQKTTLDALNESGNFQRPRFQVVLKPSRPDPENPKRSVEADFLVVDNQAKRFMLVEVKEGHVFDTKKADGELSSLKNITGWLAQEYAFKTHYYLCSFNQVSKEAIVAGAKKRFTIDHVLTGRELCELIGISFEEIRAIRSKDQIINRNYFLTELLAIPQIHQEIIELLNTSE